MRELKAGDKVRVLDGSGIERYAGGWTPKMREFVGRELEVASVECRRRVKLCGGDGYTWDSRGLELVEEAEGEDTEETGSVNKIIIDGKEYELSAELAEKIKAEVAAQEKAENPFERNVDERYYFVDASGGVGDFIDTEDATDNALYSAGNYCRDRGLMEQRALHETLNRLLWRYSETHGGDNPWDGSQAHFYIYWEINPRFGTCMTYRHKDQGTVYFREVETAQAAIEDVVKPFMAAHPKFEW